MNNLTKSFLIMFCLTAFGFANRAFAETMNIKNFVIKENPFGTNEVAVVVTDTAGIPQENVNGDFLFTINGFEVNLKFENGTAFYHQKLKKSSFIFLRHQNDSGTHSTLFYVYKSDSKLTPVHVSWVLLFAIPVFLVLLGYMFKRFIIIAAVIFCIFIYFNHSNGLSLPTFFQTVFDGLKHMF